MWVSSWSTGGKSAIFMCGFVVVNQKKCFVFEKVMLLSWLRLDRFIDSWDFLGKVATRKKGELKRSMAVGRLLDEN